MIHSDQPIDSKSTYNSCLWHSLLWLRWCRWWWFVLWFGVRFCIGSSVDKVDARSLRFRIIGRSTSSFEWVRISKRIMKKLFQHGMLTNDGNIPDRDESELKSTRMGWRLWCLSRRLETWKSKGWSVAETAVTKKLRWPLTECFRKLVTARVTLNICQPSSW